MFEQYFDSTKSTDIQDELIEGIIRTTMNHGEICVNEPENYESRAQLAWSATMALNGVVGAGKSGGDWATHQMEHSVSAYFDIAHGAGLAIIFPAWMKYVSRANPSKFVRFAEKIFGITDGTDLEKADKMIEMLQDYYKLLGAPISLTEVGVKKGDLDKLTENAALSAPMGNYKKLEKEDIRKIYELAL
ncbi:MAG: iron-containing alcohol dehydrogenase [Melioribacteraceae bacterium]|nr:iron-containing alcohol dehydrogenase [Melioribacteraceae bacterium]